MGNLSTWSRHAICIPDSGAGRRTGHWRSRQPCSAVQQWQPRVHRPAVHRNGLGVQHGQRPSTGNLNIEFVKSGYSNGSDTVGAAKDGDWFVDLNGTQGAGVIRQSFDTVAGQWYRVDYWISGNAGPGGVTMGDGAKSLDAKWNNVTADSATYLHQAGDKWSNLRWEAHSFLAQASGSSSTLSFHSTSTVYNAAGPFIDNISVTAVPEPATLALWLAGIGLVAGAARRRR